MSDLIKFQRLEKVLEQYAEAIREQYKDNLERDNRRATGKLITSINSKIVVNGNEYEIEFQLEDYWKYVEWDTRPHTLPREAIDGEDPNKPSLLNWIKVKPILPTGMNKNLPVEKQLKQLAWAIANKISKEGTKGTHDLEDTLYEVDYEHLIEEALDADILDCFDRVWALLEN